MHGTPPRRCPFYIFSYYIFHGSSRRPLRAGRHSCIGPNIAQYHRYKFTFFLALDVHEYFYCGLHELCSHFKVISQTFILSSFRNEPILSLSALPSICLFLPQYKERRVVPATPAGLQPSMQARPQVLACRGASSTSPEFAGEREETVKFKV